MSARADNDDFDDMGVCNAVKMLDITALVTEEALMSINGPNAEKYSSQHYENDEIILQFQSPNAKIQTTKSKTTINLHKESPNIHAISKSQNPMGNMHSNYNCESDIGTFKSKMERFADNVTNKLEDLESEIHNIKYCIYSFRKYN